MKVCEFLKLQEVSRELQRYVSAVEITDWHLDNRVQGVSSTDPYDMAVKFSQNKIVLEQIIGLINDA